MKGIDSVAPVLIDALTRFDGYWKEIQDDYKHLFAGQNMHNCRRLVRKVYVEAYVNAFEAVSFDVLEKDMKSVDEALNEMSDILRGNLRTPKEE